MKRRFFIFVVGGLLCAGSPCCFSQGTFINLNFENPIPPLPAGPASLPITRALPGWTGYIGDRQEDNILYNSISLGAAAITLHDASSSRPPIAGGYSITLQGQFNPNDMPGRPSAAIAQTGQIPLNAKSLILWEGTTGSLVPSFAGQTIPLFLLETSTNHTLWGGDISAFAGQTGELRLTALSGSMTGGYLDNISFSTLSIPEPSVFALTGIGALLLGNFCRRNARLK